MSDKSDKSDGSDGSDKSDGSGKSDKSGKSGKSDKSDKSGKSDTQLSPPACSPPRLSCLWGIRRFFFAGWGCEVKEFGSFVMGFAGGSLAHH